MFTINLDAVNCFINPDLMASLTLKYYYKWKIDWYHRSGGVVNSWYLGSENCPITELQFEENLKLIGAGDIKLAHIDFLIHSDDVIDIFYENEKIWTGFVDEVPEPKGNDGIKLMPFSQRLEEVIINKSYVTSSISTMLSDIFADISAITDITYNDALVNIGESTLYTINFQYVTAKKAIDTLIEKLNDRYWGVDASNNFHVYTMGAGVSAILTDGEDKWYSSIKRKYSYNNVRTTRTQNFKKGATSGQKERAGQVGYDLVGGSYPTLAIEKLKRRIEGTFELSEDGLTDAFVNDLAYAKLQKEAVLDDTITIENVRIDKINASIGDYIKVIDTYEKQLIPFETNAGVSITDAVTNWTNVNIYTDDYVNGTGCIQMLGSNPTDSAIIYDFGEILRFLNIEKICFMAFSDEVTGNVLEFSLGDTVGELWGTNYQIVINTSELWEAKYIPITETHFRYMGIRMNYTREVIRYTDTIGVNVWNEFGFPSLNVIFRFGDFRWYGYGRQKYFGNVKQKKYKIDKKGEQITYTLNAYDIQANDDFFRLNKEVEKIQDIQKT